MDIVLHLLVIFVAGLAFFMTKRGSPGVGVILFGIIGYCCFEYLGIGSIISVAIGLFIGGKLVIEANKKEMGL